MSDDFRENGHAHSQEDVAVEQLPADLAAIYERLAWDSAGWVRRLPAAAPLQDYVRALGMEETTEDTAAPAEAAAIGHDQQFGLTDAQPERLAPDGPLSAMHTHPSRRAVWGGAFSAVAVVALLVATFAILPHTHGGNTGLTRLTPTTAPTCAPNQITFTRPDHTELYQIAMTSPTDGWALGRTWSQPKTTNDYPASHQLLVWFHQCHWMPIADPLPGANVNLRNISMATAEDGWAAGFEVIGTQAHCVLLHYSHGQWQRAALPPQIQGQGPSSCEQIQMSSPEEGWLLGSWGVPSHHPSASSQLLHYVKGVWTQIESPNPDMYDLATTGPDDLWVAGLRAPALNDPDHFMRIDLAHYRHGQWTTFPLVGHAEGIWFHMNSPSDGWLVSSTLPLQVMHYDGVSWQQSPFTAHAAADGMVNVFDSSDAWSIAMTNGKSAPKVTGMQHYVDGQWQTVAWPFPDVFIHTPLTRTAPGEYWTVGARTLGPDWITGKWVLLYYAGGAWHEYGA